MCRVAVAKEMEWAVPLIRRSLVGSPDVQVSLG